MNRESFRRWPVLTAVILGGLMSVTVALGMAVVRGDLSFASSGRDVRSVDDGAGDRPRVLRLGVAYLPPPKAPDMRIYVEEGFEADLAQEIGQQLHADIELVQVPAGEQAKALEDKQVDAVLVRAAADDPLRQSAEILTTRFESGLSLVMRSDKPLHRWNELGGRLVCATEANERGQKIARSFGAEVRTVRAPAQALMLVRTGECAAAIHDRAVLDPLFRKMSWQKFSATLPPVEPASLVVAVAKGRGALAGEMRRALAAIDTVKQWQHRAERWAELVSFEVYRDQVAADCH